MRKAEPSQLRSLRLLVTGAEKLPDELAQAFEARFGKEVLQGYGLTETSPVASVNLPQLKPTKPGQTVQPSNQPGSTGKMLAGMAAEIRDPETDEKLSLHETGMLWLRGPNVFEGYLHAPEQNADVLRNGWFKTGDIGRFDEDGFLYIEGRLSRFSKIGGEMVPHETIEQKIIAALAIEEQSERIHRGHGRIRCGQRRSADPAQQHRTRPGRAPFSALRVGGAEFVDSEDGPAGRKHPDPRFRQTGSGRLQETRRRTPIS